MYYCVKTILLFAIFSLSTGIGILISKMYENRVKELRQFKNILNIIKTKIKFTYEPIPEIFEEISNSVNKNIGNIFKNAKNKMNKTTANIAWEEAIDETVTNLKQEDRNTLKTLSKLLGQTDVEGQVGQIEITQRFLEDQIGQALEEKQKNEKLYTKLGTIMGLAIIIVLF